MKEKMDYFSSIYKCVTDFKFYYIIRKHNLSNLLIYLTVLSLLLSIPTTIRAYGVFKNVFNTAELWVNEKLPEITVKNGILSADCSQPFSIEEGSWTLIIDTTGTINDLSEHDRGILLKRNEILYKENEYAQRKYDISQMKDFTLNQDTIKPMKKVALRVLGPILLAVFVFYFFISKIIHAFFFSLSGLIFNKIAKGELNYQDIFKISIAALTPSFILAVLLEIVFNITVPFWPLIYISITVFYIYSAINSIAKKSEQNI